MQRALLVTLTLVCGGCQNVGPTPKLEMHPDGYGPAGGIHVALQSLTNSARSAAEAAYTVSRLARERGEPVDPAGITSAAAAALTAAIEADSPPTIPAGPENSAKIAGAIAAGLTRAAIAARPASAAEPTDAETAKAAYSADDVTSQVTDGLAVAANTLGYATGAEAIASSALVIVAAKAEAAKVAEAAAAAARVADGAVAAAKIADAAALAKVAAEVVANPSGAAAIVTAALRAKPAQLVDIVSAAVAAAPSVGELIVAAAVVNSPGQQASIIASARAVAPRLSDAALAAAINAAVSAQVAADVAANPAGAAAIVTRAIWARPELLLAIVSAAVAAAPSMAEEIVAVAALRGQEVAIIASARAAAPQLSEDRLGLAAIRLVPAAMAPVAAAGPGGGSGGGAGTRASPGAGWAEQRILYATDRKPVEGRSLATWKSELYEKGSDHPYYGPDPEPTKLLHYGWCTVSIPAKKHQFATLERPDTGRRESVLAHITIRGIDELDKAGLLVEVAKMAAPDDQHADGKDAFIFIHGYNVTFNEAAMRAAQMAYDFNFLGAPILFSWTSRGALLGYFDDEKEVRAGGEGLRKLIADVKAGGKVRKLHLVAHSMGNRALVRALGALANDGEGRIFGQVILAAADVGRKNFTPKFAQRIIPLAERISIYVAADDRPLELSATTSGDSRLGLGGPGRFIMPGIHTIEATGVDDGMFSLRHSYFADVGPVLGDLKALLVTQVEPDNRPRSLLPSRDRTYWEIKK